MKLAKLRIKKCFGIDELELDDLGNVNTIIGPNGSGKTSLLLAIMALFGGSRKNPALLHQGADSGRVWALLDDGTEITRQITAEGAGDAVVLDPTFKAKMKSPESFLKGLVDSLSFNPVAFLQAKPKDRMQMLLEAAPVKILKKDLGFVEDERLKPLPETLDLPAIDKLRAAVYDDRRACNVALTRAQKTVEGLAETIAPTNEAEILAGFKGAQAELRSLNEKATVINKAIEGEKYGYLRDVQDDYEHELQALNDRRAEKIKKAEEEMQAKLDLMLKDMKPLVDQARADETRFEEQLKQVRRAMAQKEIVEKMRSETDLLGLQHEALDATYKKLGQVKTKILEELPIKGVDIDGETLKILDDNDRWVDFDFVNTARQVRFAIELAKLRAGSLPAVLVDRFEALTPNMRKAFLEEAQRSGVQYFIAWADDTPALEVKHE